MTGDRPRLTIKEAAEQAGVSHRTIRRRLADGAFPNAEKQGDDPLAPWSIPVTDLLAAGFKLNQSRPEPVPSTSAASDVDDDELERLRAEVQELRHRAEIAEALAAERGESLTDLRLAIRMLGPGPQPDDERQPAERRRRWWRR